MPPEPEPRRAVFKWRDAVLSEGCELPPTTRLVAVALSLYMDRDDLGSAYPGPAKLAARTGLSLSTVKAHLLALVDAGWIEQTTRGGTDRGGTCRASTYRGVPRPGNDPVREMDGAARTRDGRVPVREMASPRPGDGHHLVPHLDKDLGAGCPRCDGSGIFRESGAEFLCKHDLGLAS